MAVAATFKQECPTCQAMVTIKEAMVGKKVECTKCKDKFIAAKPVEKKKASAVVSKAPAGKKGKKVVEEVEELEEIEELDEIEEVDELDELDELEEADEEPVQVKSKKKAGTNGKAKKVELDEEEEAEDEADEEEDSADKKKSKKKSAGSNKLTMGLVLAGVGVVVLCVAAFFLLRTSSPRANPSNPVAFNPGNNTPNPPGEGEEKKEGSIKKAAPILDTLATALTDAEAAKLTNLLPNDTEHVFHVYFKELFNPAGPLRDAVFVAPGALDDADMKQKLGFAPSAIDDLIRAERYTTPGWSYTVVHLKEVVTESALKKALQLQPVEPPVMGQTYYKTAQANAWLDHLGRFSLGIPGQLQPFRASGQGKPTYVRIHNAQTLILGDEAPLQALLKAKSQFAPQSTKPVGVPALPSTEPTPKKDVTPPKEADPKQPPPVGATPPPPAGATPPDTPEKKDPTPTPTPDANAGGGTGDMYLTIKPSLKAVIERMEARGPENKEKILFSSTTDMDAGRVDTTNLPEYKNQVVRRPRQFWDVTLVLTENRPRIRLLGTALAQRDALKYQYRNEVTCAREMDAKEFQRELTERSAATVKNFVMKLFGHDIQLPSDKPAVPKEVKPNLPVNPNQPPNPNPMPEEKKAPAEVLASQMAVTQEGEKVDFVLDLVLDNSALAHVIGLSSLTASLLRVQMEAAANTSMRQGLAKAGRILGEKGLSERGVPPGTYPPGAFPRLEGQGAFDREPKNRISWMAGLLPFLGQQSLADRLKYNQSWRDPGNWLAGQTVVPQFLDPSYPNFTHQVSVGEAPIDFGATHYVGVAGVGLDAAAYKRGNPATKHKEGVFSYDGSASVEEIRQGRGLNNTILMLQVPHDGVTGVSPWIAGGGATLRGVPEKNPIAPFVLSTDRQGKIIQHQNKRGTYAVMADGSVRFIDQNVSDEVFKAMCTVHGPAPENFDPQRDPATPLISSADGKDAPKTGSKK